MIQAYYFIYGFYFGGMLLALCLAVAGTRNGYHTQSLFKLMICVVTWPIMAMQCLLDEKEEP